MEPVADPAFHSLLRNNMVAIVVRHLFTQTATRTETQMVLHHPLKEHVGSTRAHRKAIICNLRIVQDDKRPFSLTKLTLSRGDSCCKTCQDTQDLDMEVHPTNTHFSQTTSRTVQGSSTSVFNANSHRLQGNYGPSPQQGGHGYGYQLPPPPQGLHGYSQVS